MTKHRRPKLKLCVIWYCEIAVMAKLLEFVRGYLRYALENTNTTKFSIKIPYPTSMVSYLLSVPLLPRFVESKGIDSKKDTMEAR